MAQDDGLRALEVRVARQRRLDRLGGARDERFLDAPQAGTDPRDDLSEVQAFVDRDLVVAGAPGVQLAADLTDQLLKTPLDVHVDVLELRAVREGTRRQLVPDRGEPSHDRVALGGGQEPRPGEGLGPGDAPGDVVRPEPPIEGERPGEPLGGRIGALRESPAPELLRLRRVAPRRRALAGP